MCARACGRACGRVCACAHTCACAYPRVYARRRVRMGAYGRRVPMRGVRSCVAVCGAVWPWRGRGRGLRRAVVVSWLRFAMLSVVGLGFVTDISY